MKTKIHFVIPEFPSQEEVDNMIVPVKDEKPEEKEVEE